MSDSLKSFNQKNKIDLIESLIKENKFKEALAEIREEEIRKNLDRISPPWGWLSHLAAKSLQGLGRGKEAAERAQEALKIFQNTPEHERFAQIQFNLGVIYSDLGDLRNSELQFQDAASTYRRIGNKRGIITTYNELSRICFTKAKYDAAIEYLNDGVGFCQEIKDQKLAAVMLGNLGTVYIITDRWGKARQELLKSLDLNKIVKNEINLCRSYLSLSNVSILLRDFPPAEDYLKKAWQIIHENSLAREAAISHEYSGQLAFIQGNFDTANQHYLEAIKLGEKIAPKSTIISQSYRLMAELQAEEGKYREALASCEKSLEVSKDIGERIEEAVVYRILGHILNQNGRLAEEVKENFIRATRMLEEMGVKFELAKTYLEMSKSDIFDIREKMKFLGRAEDLTSQLDSPFYLAKVLARSAELYEQNDRLAEAQDFVNKARCLFEQLSEKAELKSLAALEKKIENAHPQSHSTCTKPSGAYSLEDIITRDRATLDILESIRQIMDLDVTILLEGETGTGKDLLAKVIHQCSNRRDNKFVVVNCAALPESLFESELFGHKKGSFTGSVSDKKGLLDEAVGGTLYLDEIAEVPLPIQVKLLRAIEEKEITRLGEVKPRKVDFRVIAATNKNLDELVQEGRFRSDLFYRLNVMRFKLPPLRKRLEDVPLLVEYFIKEYSANGMKQDSITDDNPSSVTIPTLDPRIMELFINYQWPGNIRELENEVKRLLICSRGESKISFDLLSGSLEKFNGKPLNDSLISQMANYEKEQIEKALAKANGVKTKAARLLNIDEAKLRYKMKKLGISPPQQEA